MRIGLQNSPLPILLLMSGRDLTASEFDDLAKADPAWRRALSREGVQIVRLAGADHTFSERAALEQATTHCGDWLRRIRTAVEGSSRR